MTNKPALNQTTLAAFVATFVAFQEGRAAQITVFYDDFNGALPAQISGVGTLEPVAGFSGAGIGGNVFSGSLLRNAATGNPAAATVLTLSGLPAHNSVDIDFLLAAIDSWDGLNGSPAPDLFNVRIDGSLVLSDSYISASGSSSTISGTLIAGLAGRGWSGWSDQGYDMGTAGSLSVPHVASTLTVQFYASGTGWQGGGDESFAIDNLKVTLNTVPDAGSSLLLFSLSSLGLITFRRRRR